MNEIIRPWEASAQNSMPANIKDIKGIVEYGNNNLTLKQQNRLLVHIIWKPMIWQLSMPGRKLS